MQHKYIPVGTYFTKLQNSIPTVTTPDCWSK